MADSNDKDLIIPNLAAADKARRAARKAAEAQQRATAASAPSTTERANPVSFAPTMLAATHASFPVTPATSRFTTDEAHAWLEREFEGTDRHELTTALAELSLDPEWVAAAATAYVRPAKPVRTIVLHTNPDLEALAMAWLLLKFAPVREHFNILPGARLAFVPSGALDPKAPIWARFAPEQVHASFLERHEGYLFVDCGGGGALLDQHGRAENVRASKISSLDRLIGCCPRLLCDIRHLVVILRLISENDKTGAKIAKDPGKRKSKTPHTDRHLRNVISGLNDMIVEERSLTWEKMAEYVFLALDAVDNATSVAMDAFIERGISEASIALGKDERRWSLFLLQTMLDHLPKAPTPEEAETRARNRADIEIEDASVRAPVDQEWIDRTLARCVREERMRAARFGEFIAEATDRFRGALLLREAAWTQAMRDWKETGAVAVREDVCFSRRDDEGATADGKIPTVGRVYVCSLLSDSPRAGGYSRYLMNGLEKQRVKWLLINAVRERLGVPAGGPEADPEERAFVVARIKEIIAASKESAAADAAVVVTAADSVQSIAPEGTPTDKEGQPDDMELEELDDETEDAYLQSLAPEAVVRQGDYAGLQRKHADPIKDCVRKVKANVVTLQMSDEVVAAGKVVNCKYGVATTQFLLDDIEETLRQAIAKAWGRDWEVLTTDLRAAGPFLLRNRKTGVIRQVTFYPEFRTYTGSRFNTNKTLPACGLGEDALLECINGGLTAGNEAIRLAAGRGDLTLERPGSMALLAEIATWELLPSRLAKTPLPLPAPESAATG